MGRGERIEIANPCPLTPSSKRSLRLQGIKKSLNLHFRTNSILVTVSLVLVLMASGLVIIWIPIRDMLIQGEMHYPRWIDELSLLAGMGWSGITLLAGLMIIKKRLNLHSRPNPFKVAVSLTLILMAGGLVILWIVVYLIDPGAVGTEYHWMANVLWSGMTFLGGPVILVPHETPSEPVKVLRRLKCPHCAAVYAYDEQEGVEPGFVRCQNCDTEFGPTTDKQAAQASSIIS